MSTCKCLGLCYASQKFTSFADVVGFSDSTAFPQYPMSESEEIKTYWEPKKLEWTQCAADGDDALA